MARVTEYWRRDTFHGSNEEVREVFERLPPTMQEVLLLAAAEPDTWIRYEDADERVGNKAGTFGRSFGGYRSKDPDRPRPFHLGKDSLDRFYLLIDGDQAKAIAAAG